MSEYSPLCVTAAACSYILNQREQNYVKQNEHSEWAQERSKRYLRGKPIEQFQLHPLNLNTRKHVQ